MNNLFRDEQGKFDAKSIQNVLREESKSLTATLTGMGAVLNSLEGYKMVKDSKILYATFIYNPDFYKAPYLMINFEYRESNRKPMSSMGISYPNSRLVISDQAVVDVLNTAIAKVDSIFADYSRELEDSRTAARRAEEQRNLNALLNWLSRIPEADITYNYSLDRVINLYDNLTDEQRDSLDQNTLDKITRIMDVIDAAKDEEKRLASERAEARRKAEEERKYQAKKEREMKKLAGAKPENIRGMFKEEDRFFFALGWMAKHLKRIRAAMPDYSEDWFRRIFNGQYDDEALYVVDTRIKTSGGYDRQWNFGFTMSFDTEIPEGIPELFSKATSANKRVISNVGFIWTLIIEYGFRFSKTQDLDAIKSYVPADSMDAFEEGYAI